MQNRIQAFAKVYANFEYVLLKVRLQGEIGPSWLNRLLQQIRAITDGPRPGAGKRSAGEFPLETGDSGSHRNESPVSSTRSQHSISAALRINPGCEAYASLAYNKLLFEWDFEGAEKAFLHSLQLNPNHTPAHYWYALFLAATARDEEALRQVGLALELDPLSLVTNTHKGWVLYFARRYDHAIEQLLSTIEMDETFQAAHYFLGLVYLQTRQYKDAANQFQRAARISNNHPAAITGLARSLGLSGRKEEARKILARVERSASRRYVAPYYLAVSYLALGNKRGTIQWLHRAFEERSPYMSNLRRDPELDPIRSDPAFVELLQQTRILPKRRAAKAKH